LNRIVQGDIILFIFFHNLPPVLVWPSKHLSLDIQGDS